MQLTKEEQIICDEACKFILSKKNELIDKFVLQKNPLKLGFITIFMAGSPGAGKTEFSQRYMPLVFNKKDEKLIKFLKQKDIDIDSAESLFIRIDVDEIREFFPQYKKTDIEKGLKGNAHVIQKAAGKGLDILRDYCLSSEISFLHDGTFGNYSTMREIIKKSISSGREVQIYYLYLDPLEAWKFTKAREYLEGRNIIKEKFIEQYFHSQENVDKIKVEFNDKVKINCVLKDNQNNVLEIALNHPSIDQFLQTQYTKGIIKRYSAGDLSNLIN